MGRPSCAAVHELFHFYRQVALEELNCFAHQLGHRAYPAAGHQFIEVLPLLVRDADGDDRAVTVFTFASHIELLELLRHRLDLAGSKDRPVLADVDVPNVAAAAFPQAALHPVLQGGVDLLVREAQLLQHRQGELDHDRRTADQRDSVLGTRRRLLQDGGDEADPAVPLRAVAPRIDRLDEIDVTSLLPLLEFPLVDQIALSPGAVDDGDVAELVPLVERIPDQGPQGGEGDTAGHEHQVPAVEILDGEGVPVGAPYSDAVPDFEPSKGFGHFSHSAEAALDMAGAGRGRGDAEGRFAGAERRVLGKLPGAEGELLPYLLILEHQAEGPDIRGLVDDLLDGGQVRLIDILVRYAYI